MEREQYFGRAYCCGVIIECSFAGIYDRINLEIGFLWHFGLAKWEYSNIFNISSYTVSIRNWRIFGYNEYVLDNVVDEFGSFDFGFN